MGLRILMGMTADELLKAMRQAGVKETKAPEKIGRDANGLIVRWFLPDSTVTLRRPAYVAPYCVAAIDDAEGQEGERET